MRKAQAERLAVSVFALIIFALGLGAKMINKSVQMEVLDAITFWLWTGAGILGVLIMVVFLLNNRIYKGFHYFWNYWMIKNSLELQMIDANFGI